MADDQMLGDFPEGDTDGTPMRETAEDAEVRDRAYRVTAGELRQFVERYERLEAERVEIAGQMKEVMAEAKARGYDTKVLRKLIALTGSNLDTTIAIDVEADVAEPGVGCIPAADFLKLATAARKAMISIEATANVAVVRFARAEASLSLWPADEFPLPSFDLDMRPVDGELLASALRFVAPAAAGDEVAYHLCGVFLEDQGGDAYVVACDQKSIHWATMPGTSLGSPGIIIHNKDVPILAELAGSGGPFKAAFAANYWAASNASCRMRGKVVDATYVPWRAVANGDLPHVATVDAADLTSALAVASIGVTDIDRRTVPVVLDARNGAVTLRGLRPGSTMTKAPAASIAADVQGEVMMTFASSILLLAASVSDDSIAIFASDSRVDMQPAVQRTDLRLAARLAPHAYSKAEMAA